jgi:hypothetical protein
MDSVNIEYRIKLSQERTEHFNFELDGESFDLKGSAPPNPPEWTRLSFKQCPHCPLTEANHPRCPLALQLHDIVNRFHDTRSIDKVELEVVTQERRVIQTLDIQRAIASILDLIMPICGCPKTACLKPLARFHLPLASEEETVFRVTGMYLLAQYFLSHASSGSRIELDGLSGIYEGLHDLNKAVTSRLRDVTRSDSLKNAFALVDTYSILVPLLVEDRLVEMRGFFESYLQGTESKQPVAHHLEEIKAFKLELVPLEGEVGRGDDRPAWLREVSGEIEPEPVEPETPEAEQQAADPRAGEENVIEKILSKSEFTFELEPMARRDNEDDADGPSAK